MSTSKKLSEKQLRFLNVVEVANRPVEIEIMKPPRSIPHYLGNGFAYDWCFRSEGDAKRWVQNLRDRGLITIEKDHFIRITDEGRALIDASSHAPAAQTKGQP